VRRTRQLLGDWGESLVGRFLQEKGYTLLDSKARTPYGELDLVARQGNATVFIEVKTRRTKAFGAPEEGVTRQKQAHLLASAQAYLQAHPQMDGDWRIDVISVFLSESGTPEIVHFENAVN
jgi:putative endonuclease